MVDVKNVGQTMDGTCIRKKEDATAMIMHMLMFMTKGNAKHVSNSSQVVNNANKLILMHMEVHYA